MDKKTDAEQSANNMPSEIVDEHPKHADAAPRLPFSKWWPFVGGVLAGVALRLVFSQKPGNPYTAMAASFIYLGPFFVGAVTVYLAERIQRRTWGYYLWASFLANVVFVAGTLVIMIEGWICAILILPLFGAIGAVGGLIMGIVCRVTKWPKHTIYGIGILPLLLASLEPHVPLPERVRVVERSVTIDAAPSTVWKQIHNARDIKADEVEQAWAYRIGVPMPLAGITERTSTGLVRKITMGKNVHFDQAVADSQENQYVRWAYRFYQDSFPPNALDEHVKIGGHHFDLHETSYTLTPSRNRTELKTRMQYETIKQISLA